MTARRPGSGERPAAPGAAPLTRRELLVGGTAVLATAALGGCARAEGAVPDLCVIGSGFAGTFLALRAVERGLRTVLVEAGTRHAEDFGFGNRGEVAYDVGAYRFIGLGGGSNLWAGDLARLRPSSLRMRSAFGLSADWPLSYEELAPWYCEAEQRLHARGWEPVPELEPPRACAYPQQQPLSAAARERLPRFAIDGRPAGFFRVARSRRDGRPLHLAGHELPAFERSRGATLLADRRVVRLVTADGRRVDHAEARTPDGSLERIRARRFAVAAGVVESARLLLLSRSPRHPEGLGNGHGLVGRFFNAHPLFQSELEARELESLPRGYYRSHSLSDDFRREGLGSAWFGYLSRRDLRVWRFSPELEARAENRVGLSWRRDRFDAALPELSFGFSSRDRRTFERGTSARPSIVGERALRFERYWHGHPSGTCRMADDEASGVVDRNNKVFGLENLYVSGACTFPTPGTANPTDTVVALTLRLADHLVALSRPTGAPGPG